MTKSLNEVLNETLDKIVNEEELTRLYHENDKLSIDGKLGLIQGLLSSAMLNELNPKHRIARAKQVLWIIYKYGSGEDISDDDKRRIANYKAVAHHILHPYDGDLIEAGKGYLAQGQYREALYHFNLVISRNPDNYEAHSHRKLALDGIEKIKPEDVDDEKLLEIGKLLSIYGRHETAIERFKALKERNPEHPWVDYDMGHTFDRIGGKNLALTCFEQAMCINPHTLIRYTLAKALVDDDKAALALGQLQAALKKDSQNIYAIALLGDLPKELEPQELLREPEEYTNNDALHEAGKTLFKLGKNEDSIKYFDFLINRDPNFRWARIEKAKPLFTLGRLEEAIACCEKEVRINPHTWSFHDLGMYHLEKGDLEKAETALRTSIEYHHNNEWARYRLGVCYHRQNKLEEAEKELDLALKIGHGDNDLRLRLSKAFYNIGKSVDKRENKTRIYEKACKLNEEDKAIRNNLGWSYFVEKRYKEAKKEFLAAIDIDPNYALAHSNLGQLYEKKGDNDLAKKHYEKAVELGYEYAGKRLAKLEGKQNDS